MTLEAGCVQDALPLQDAAPQRDTSPRMASPPVLAAAADSAERTPEIHRESPRAPEAQHVPAMAPGWTTTLRWPAALVVVAGLVAALYWFERPQRLALHVYDSDGQMRISWDRSVKPVSQGRNAHLEINDGGATAWVELDREQLRDGNVQRILQLTFRGCQAVPFQLGQDDILRRGNRQLLPMKDSPFAAPKFLVAEGAILPDDEVRFPAFGEIDDVEHRPPPQGPSAGPAVTACPAPCARTPASGSHR